MVMNTQGGGRLDSNGAGAHPQSTPLWSAFGFLAEFDPNVLGILLDMADGGVGEFNRDTERAAALAAQFYPDSPSGVVTIEISPPCGGTVTLTCVTFPVEIWELVYA
jgi:hypothetical protein